MKKSHTGKQPDEIHRIPSKDIPLLPKKINLLKIVFPKKSIHENIPCIFDS